MQDALHRVVEDERVRDLFSASILFSREFPRETVKSIQRYVPSDVRSGSQDDTEVTGKLFALVNPLLCVVRFNNKTRYAILVISVSA